MRIGSGDDEDGNGVVLDLIDCSECGYVAVVVAAAPALLQQHQWLSLCVLSAKFHHSRSRDSIPSKVFVSVRIEGRFQR